MAQARLIGWLLVAGLLLAVGWWLTSSLLSVQQASAPLPVAAADVDPEIERLARVESQIEARHETARHCLRQAQRGLGLVPSELVPLLVIVTGAQCRANCASESIAQGLVDAYRLEGVQVLLIRTALGDAQTPSPAGVPTVAVAGCASLVAEHGDDYWLRLPDGRLDSSGHRHEAMLRRPPPEDPSLPPQPPPAFDPEPVLRAAMNLRRQ